MINLSNDKLKKRVNELSNIIRAEYITDVNYLELYAGAETIDAINNIKNQVIYGRRGTGKTHLLRAFQEVLVEQYTSEKRIPIYIDLRKLLPLISVSDSNSIEFSIIVFKHIIDEIIKVLVENINFLYEINEFEEYRFGGVKKIELEKKLNDLNVQFDGKEYKKLDEVQLSEEEIKKIALSLEVSKDPQFDASRQKETTVTQNFKRTRYLSFADISNLLSDIPDLLDIKRIVCILDEWSEIPLDSQLYLAELIKRGFITSKFTFKIAAITNRARLGKSVEGKFIGLEDGGDIFPFNLDNRFVYEVNAQKTKDFFNDLLHKHLISIDNKLEDRLFNEEKKSGFLNIFLANQALREILIASAGIPRDFINLFINAYDQYIVNTSNSNARIGVKHIRLATIDWYRSDKKEQVDGIHSCKILLEEIINEIVIGKKKTHFLIPQKYNSNSYLNQLIDFRVIHLRKKGYSHKGNSGVVYDVYSVDYGCYTSIDVPQSKLDIDFINKIDAIDNFRDIRRISLEDKFFESFLLNIGDAFTCPHCKAPVDTNHPAYVKRKLCNNCFLETE